VGIVVNRNILISLCYDHIDLEESDLYSRRQGVDPLTVDIEVGRPGRSRFTPRITAGAGPYFQDDKNVYYIYPGSTRTQTMTSAAFGMHFGAGVSVPLTKRMMIDLDYRYHQTVGKLDALVIGSATVGLRFLFPGHPSEEDGYVLSSESRPIEVR